MGDPFEPRGGCQLLLEDLPGLLQRDDLRGQHSQALQTLVNRRFDDVEVPGRPGLGMAGVEEGTDVGISDFRRRHRLLP